METEAEIKKVSFASLASEHVTQVYIGKDLLGRPEISEIVEGDLFDQAAQDQNIIPMTRKEV